MERPERVEIGEKVYEKVKYDKLKSASPCWQCDVEDVSCRFPCCAGDGHILKEVKEEPETKRDNPRGAEKAWVLHKFDLLDQTEYVSIRQRDKGHNSLSEQDVKVYSDNRVNETIEAEGAACEFRMIEINPPTSEPETVEQVMDDKPGLPDIKADPRLHIDDYLAWAKRLIEAEEREQLNGKS